MENIQIETVKIDELPEAGSLNNEDVLPVAQNNNLTGKVSLERLKGFVNDITGEDVRRIEPHPATTAAVTPDNVILVPGELIQYGPNAVLGEGVRYTTIQDFLRNAGVDIGEGTGSLVYVATVSLGWAGSELLEEVVGDFRNGFELFGQRTPGAGDFIIANEDGVVVRIDIVTSPTFTGTVIMLLAGGKQGAVTALSSLGPENTAIHIGRFVQHLRDHNCFTGNVMAFFPWDYDANGFIDAPIGNIPLAGTSVQIHTVEAPTTNNTSTGHYICRLSVPSAPGVPADTFPSRTIEFRVNVGGGNPTTSWRVMANTEDLGPPNAAEIINIQRTQDSLENEHIADVPGTVCVPAEGVAGAPQGMTNAKGIQLTSIHRVLEQAGVDLGGGNADAAKVENIRRKEGDAGWINDPGLAVCVPMEFTGSYPNGESEAAGIEFVSLNALLENAGVDAGPPGPPGADGAMGPPGPPGTGVADPGVLSLIANSAMPARWEGDWTFNSGVLTAASSGSRVILIPIDKSENTSGFLDIFPENTNWPTITGLGTSPNITAVRNITIPIWTAVIARPVRGGNESGFTLRALVYTQTNTSRLLQPGDIFICARDGANNLTLSNGMVIGGDARVTNGLLFNRDGSGLVNLNAGNMAVGLGATANTDIDTSTPMMSTGPINILLQSIWNKMRSVVNWSSANFVGRRGSLTNGADLNTFGTNGIWTSLENAITASLVNAPFTPFVSFPCQLVVMVDAASTLTQTITTFPSVGSGLPRVFRRARYGGSTWLNWIELAKTSDIGNAALTLQVNGTAVANNFTANSGTDRTYNITRPLLLDALGSGRANNRFLRGDGTWAFPPAEGGSGLMQSFVPVYMRRVDAGNQLMEPFKVSPIARIQLLYDNNNWTATFIGAKLDNAALGNVSPDLVEPFPPFSVGGGDITNPGTAIRNQLNIFLYVDENDFDNDDFRDLFTYNLRIPVTIIVPVGGSSNVRITGEWFVNQGTFTYWYGTVVNNSSVPVFAAEGGSATGEW